MFILAFPIRQGFPPFLSGVKGLLIGLQGWCQFWIVVMKDSKDSTGSKQGLIFVLPMNVHKKGPQTSERLYRNLRIIDKGLAFSLCGNAAA